MQQINQRNLRANMEVVNRVASSIVSRLCAIRANVLLIARVA